MKRGGSPTPNRLPYLRIDFHSTYCGYLGETLMLLAIARVAFALEVADA